MSDEDFTVFGTKVDEDVFQSFVNLYKMIDEDSGRLTDIQRSVLIKKANGKRHKDVMEDEQFNNIGSVQAGIKGGISNILDSLADLTWLFKNSDIIDFIERYEG